MSEQTETERNEADLAIAELENYKSQLPMHFYDAVVLDDATVDAALSSLKQQSESERKIEKVREYCKNTLELDSFNYVDEAIDDVCNKILEILEGAE